MKLCSLASGSSGNCIFAGSEETSLLFDAGISGKRVEQGLNSFDYTGKDIHAIFVTHEHADHISGLGVLARRLVVPIYATEGTIRAIQNTAQVGKIPDSLFHPVYADRPVQVGDMEIEPFSISHDAADPVGYRITSGTHSAAIATDMGTYTDYTVRHLQYCDTLLLEANHDIRMLEMGRYPYPLKVRIMSDKGHLSNEASGRLLCQVLHDHLKYIVLGHLSAENNYPALAYETVCSEVTTGDNPYRADDFPISVAGRSSVGELLEF